MSRQQLQETEAAAVPDKAMLATVLNYLKNNNLKETEEVLKKELSHHGDESMACESMLQVSAVGQSGAEPMKYEESYISKAPSTNTSTAAPFEQHEEPTSSLTTTALLNHNKLENLHNVVIGDKPGEDVARNASPVKLLPMNGDRTIPGLFSNGVESVSNPISLSQVLGSSIVPPLPSTPPSAAAYTSNTKTPDDKPLWLRNPLLPVSSAAISPSLASSVCRPSTLGGKPLVLPMTSLPAPSGDTSTTTQNVTICHPMMYQLMSSPSCISQPLLAPVLTVLKSPPSLVPTPSMLLTNPLSAVNQGLALKPVIKPIPATPSQTERVPSDSTTPDDVVKDPMLFKPIMAATGQAMPIQESSPVSSTTTTTSNFPHPRTLASIHPSELTPQLIELKAFAEDFKTRRIRLGFTQGSVGQSLAERGYNNFAQSTISRFEQMQLSPANAATIRVILEKWLLEAESPEPTSASTNTIPQIAGRKRKKRAVFTPQTRAVLEEFFSQNPRPNRQAIENISQKLDLLPEEVRVWFCNKRQKSKSGSISSSNGGMVHRTSFDRESSLSSSGVPSPTFSDGGMSQKNRSPSPPKTPFTIEELSKSSIASAGSPVSANTPPTPVVSSLGIMASVTQSMSPLFSSGVFSNPLLPPPFVANTRA